MVAFPSAQVPTKGQNSSPTECPCSTTYVSVRCAHGRSDSAERVPISQQVGSGQEMSLCTRARAGAVAGRTPQGNLRRSPGGEEVVSRERPSFQLRCLMLTGLSLLVFASPIKDPLPVFLA